MTIHHSVIKKAEKAGVQLTEHSELGVRAFWPKRAVELFADSASEALKQMQAAQVLVDQFSYRVQTTLHDPYLVSVINSDDMLMVGEHTAYSAYDAIQKEKAEWAEKTDITQKAKITDPSVERIKGIAVDGAIAYKEGVLSADCPYNSEDEGQYDDFLRWNEEWDAAADAEPEEHEGGSVVSTKYRARYAEAGHPTHCGDWLAELLNNLVLTKKATDIERFETICNANGVSLAKYNRTTKGWEGRIRMTGRNLLTKKVWEAGGVIKTPVDGAEPEYRAPAEWMAAQRFNKK